MNYKMLRPEITLTLLYLSFQLCQCRLVMGPAPELSMAHDRTVVFYSPL